MTKNRCTRHRRARRTFPGPFLADDAWWACSDSSIAEFCADAFLVDGFEPRTLLNTPCLALRVHMPTELAELELAECIEDLDNIRETFYTLDDTQGAGMFWRCNVDWIHPDRRIYSIAGKCDASMLDELRAAHLLMLVEESIWHRWEFIDAHLCICNDQHVWLRCEA